MRALSAAMMLITAMPTLAASPKVEGAVKVFQALTGDADKLKIFCELMDIDEKLLNKHDPVLEAQMHGLLDALGADFKVAWDVVEATNERSADGRALSAALDELEDKCPD